MPAEGLPPYWLPAEHSMDRRHQVNDYHIGHKAYMVTLKAEDMAPLFSSMAESPEPGRIAECRLTPLGEAMRHAWLTLPERFHNIAIVDSPDEYVIMPEHFHGIIYVVGYMQEHLSDVVRLFKARVAMSYRKLLIEGAAFPVGTAKDWLQAYHTLPPQQQAAAKQWVEAQLPILYSATRRGTQTGANTATAATANTAVAAATTTTTATAATAASITSEQERLGPSPIRVAASGSHGKRGFLFATGYTDSLLLDGDNLQGHRRYILDNPRSRWMRSHNRALLKVDRTGIDTAVTITALEGYLKRECPPRDVSDDKLAIVRSLLLYSATRRGTQQRPTAGTQAQQQSTAQQQTAEGQSRCWIECQSYGDRSLLQRKMLPVVCHRKDAALFHLQKARCLKEAEAGTVMVSASISPHEREIMKEVMNAGHPVVRIEDNGFPEIYHPSQTRTDLCAAQRLLILSPWQYHYRHKDEAVFVAYCKTMNCIAQALCRCKDDWWKATPQ